jgi:hypothetical protein
MKKVWFKVKRWEGDGTYENEEAAKRQEQRVLPPFYKTCLL